MKKVNFVSLGCAKNLVDTETAAGLLGSEGWALTAFPEEADAVVLNTCAFTREAREESKTEIRRLSKKISPGAKFVICGCLGQLEGKELFKKFPRIDSVAGSSDYRYIGGILKKLDGKKHFLRVGKADFIAGASFPRLISTPASYAYIKIAEGCSNHCSYCMIPKLRGNYRSRSVKDILTEAAALAKMGIKELILIANDTAFYGNDPSGRALGNLLERLSGIKSIRRIRTLYMHPSHVSEGLIKKIASLPKVARYFDIPIQHTDSVILKKMNRRPFEETESLIESIRKHIPGAAIRTTFITGFPGETKKRCRKLIEDIKRIKFSWAGVFNYSPEKGSAAAALGGRPSSAVALLRAKEVMKVQRKISFDFARSAVGSHLEIIADSAFRGRTEFQTPGVDGEVIFLKKQRPGSVKKMTILKAKGYDLIA
ncbi:30S ribosomal protein S12 methylthiotransferase RimO [bacterium]|nr:30S ribosomal protein S12 methylthiotransferase RimO [bacterium]